MVQNKEKIYSYIIAFAILLIFLDAYQVNGIPINWIGLSLLIVPSIFEFKKLYNDKNLRNILFSILFLSIPDILNIFDSRYINLDYQYLILRYFNLISFALTLIFSYKFFQNSSQALFLNILEKFIIIFSLVTIYIFFAQIFDLYEPYRNRQNTDLFGDSKQSTFWLSQPHRAMGTFREPVFLISFFYPIVLLYLFLKKDVKTLVLFIAGVALGLTRSDYARFFSILLLLFIVFNFLLNKDFLKKMTLLVITILFFSNYGILECNVNPSSNECKNYEEDVEKINNSGKLKVKSNSSNPITDLDDDRLKVVSYFLSNISQLRPVGLSNVNLNYKNYLEEEINNEMYLTNRILPSFLLKRYSTQDFGTGSYSVTKYTPNVQNLFIFYTVGFGYLFPALIFIIFINILYKYGFTRNIIFFFSFILMMFISPIEEFNSFYGLILGFSYKLLLSENNESF